MTKASVVAMLIIVEEEEASLPSPGIRGVVCDVAGCVSATPRDSNMESASGAKDSILVVVGGILELPDDEAVETVEPPEGGW